MALRDQLKNTDAWKHVSEDARDPSRQRGLGVAYPRIGCLGLSNTFPRKSTIPPTWSGSFIYIARHGDDTTRQTWGDHVAASISNIRVSIKQPWLGPLHEVRRNAEEHSMAASKSGLMTSSINSFARKNPPTIRFGIAVDSAKAD
jgi:hypothetical protein